MKITVYGSGCVMCGGLGMRINDAVDELEIENIQVEKVCDPASIEEAGITETPALAVNDKVVISGRIPETEEIVEALKKEKDNSELKE